MAYNTKQIVKDKDGNPISQYYSKELDKYEPVEGANGGNKVVVENNDLSLIPILDKLSQLTGTILDEETRKANETTRQSNETLRVNAETSRKNAENTRITSEKDRVTKETDRVAKETNRVDAEKVRVSNETTRKTDETARNSNENIRKLNETARISNENLRIALYDDLKSKVANGYFKGEKGDTGNGLEFNWRGNELGVRVKGDTQYVYVDLKGEKGDTGSIENLTKKHVTDALGYTPPEKDTITTINSKTGVITKQDIVALGIPAQDTIVQVVDNLTSNDANKALSAKQGKELFQSVSNGKQVIATAITDKGIITSSSDTFQKMASNINSIETGGKIINIVKNVQYPEKVSSSSTISLDYLGVPFSPKWVAFSTYGLKLKNMYDNNNIIYPYVSGKIGVYFNKLTHHSMEGVFRMETSNYYYYRLSLDIMDIIYNSSENSVKLMLKCSISHNLVSEGGRPIDIRADIGQGIITFGN